MKGLLIKDFLVLTRQMKVLLILIPIMAIADGSSLGSIATLIGAMLPMTAMAYDEQSKWNDLAVMMPYSRRDIVLSKYVIGYLGTACAAAISAAAQVLLASIRHHDAGGNLSMVAFAFVSGLLLIAVNTPISFRFGVQKGRIVFFILFGVCFTLGTLFQDSTPSLPPGMISALPAMTVLFALVLNVFSVLISFRVKRW